MIAAGLPIVNSRLDLLYIHSVTLAGLVQTIGMS